MKGKRLLQTVVRRRHWLFARLDPRKLVNLALAGGAFLLRRETTPALPAMVKIDISPLCNLRCTACVHADANGEPTLEAQQFGARDRMSLEQYRRIIDRIRGRTIAVSLYYLGDPLVHPDLDAMCRIAADAGLQVHVSTNLSFGLSDARIRSLVTSGLSHLTVCLDGLVQEQYERTRVGGNIARVLENLRRICETRRALDTRQPRIEAQYILYQHNEHDEPAARALCAELGVDEFASFWGALDNWAGRSPERYRVLGPRRAAGMPLCSWPHFSTVVKFNGDVIPCCNFRQGEQYARGVDSKAFGNVFEQGLDAIWNGPAYRRARQLTADPARAERDPTLREHFCHACPELYETTFQETTLWGNQVRFEDVYEIDERGRPVRRRAS